MTSLRKNEKQFLFIGLFSLLLLITFFTVRPSIQIPHGNFLLLHTLLELFSIFVSFSIFIQAWITYSTHSTKYQYFVGLIFLAVGCFDLLHTITYKGMPFIINGEMNATRATWFWVIARITESIGVALFIVKTIEFSIIKRGIGLSLTLILISIWTSVILFIPDRLPVLFNESTGMSELKLVLEYIISTINVMTLIVLLKRYKNQANIDSLRLIFAILSIMIGELFFTLYVHVYDIENIIGHIFKFTGYIFLLRSIFFPEFQQILKKKKEAEIKRMDAELKLYDIEKSLSRQVFEAHEKERKHVSRELHDSIGQSLYGILVTLNTIDKEQSIEKKAESLQTMKVLTENAMKEVKGIAQSLRPSTLDDLGFIPTLRSYLESYKQIHSIPVEFEISGAKIRLQPDMETALYRICQEALTNTAKYAQASLVQVSLHFDQQDAHLTIQDNGKGFLIEDYLNNKNRKGIGLFSIKERAEGLGGSIHFHSIVNKGTTINIRIPIPAE